MSSLFPDQPVSPECLEPELLAGQGPWGGPVYSYRDAEIRCGPGGHVCSLFLDGHPLDRASFGALGTIRPLVDAWLDEGRLPSHLRAVPRAAKGAGE